MSSSKPSPDLRATQTTRADSSDVIDHGDGSITYYSECEGKWVYGADSISSRDYRLLHGDDRIAVDRALAGEEAHGPYNSPNGVCENV